MAVAIALVAALGVLGIHQGEPPASPGTGKVTTTASGPSSFQGAWKAATVEAAPVQEAPVEAATVEPAPVQEVPVEAAPVEAEVPTSFAVADAIGPTVSIFVEPGVPYADRPTLANPTNEGLPVVFLVIEDQGAWLKVRVSSRPNNLIAWVQRSEVNLRTVPNRVLVEIGARQVTVFQGEQVLLQETVAVGSDRTPSPLGNFFVDGIVPLSPDTGPYGAGQVSVSGFSDVLQSFGGGVGQIALHGTNQPQLLGQPVSNGCVRMTNDAITRMAQLAPLGTPVDIVA